MEELKLKQPRKFDETRNSSDIVLKEDNASDYEWVNVFATVRNLIDIVNHNAELLKQLCEEKEIFDKIYSTNANVIREHDTNRVYPCANCEFPRCYPNENCIRCGFEYKAHNINAPLGGATNQ